MQTGFVPHEEDNAIPADLTTRYFDIVGNPYEMQSIGLGKLISHPVG